MKSKQFLVILAIFIGLKLYSQVLETEKSHPLSKDAKKGYLGSFQYDATSKQYSLVFVREMNKQTIYETMKFDYDFNQIDSKSEALSLTEASEKYDFVEYDENKWVDPEVVRVDANTFGAGNVTLKKGTISREWMRPQAYVSGNYLVSYAGYWKYNFNESEKITPKIEVDVELDPRTPEFVKKMAVNSAKKIYLTAYMTDEPSVDIQTGRRYYNPRLATSGYFNSKKAFSSATGDIVVLGRQFYAISKTYFNRFVALKYSAKDLTELNRTLIEVNYGADAIYKQILPDQTLAVILAPLPAASVKPGEPNPNPRAFTWLRIDKDAKVIERIEFESPGSKWDINTIQLNDNGDIYVYGEASQKNNDKYYMQQTGITKFDNFQLMKISGGKLAFITSTPVEEFEKKLQAPAGMKVEAYTGKKFDVGSLTLSNSGDIFISGQDNDAGKFGNLSLFHFDSNGKLKAQYGYALQEKGKESQSMPTIHVELENPDSKSMTWFVYEMVGETTDKLLIYPMLGTIDIEKGTISGFSQYGKAGDNMFYVDNSRPVILIDDNKKVVFFGADKKDKEIWFCRVKLGN